MIPKALLNVRDAVGDYEVEIGIDCVDVEDNKCGRHIWAIKFKARPKIASAHIQD